MSNTPVIFGNGIQTDGPLIASQNFNLNSSLSVTTGMDDVNVSGKNILIVPSGNAVTLNGLTGGVSGQVLYAYCPSSSGDLTLVHNSSTAGTQKFISPNGGNISIGLYGGVTLICNGSIWYVVGTSTNFEGGINTTQSISGYTTAVTTTVSWMKVGYMVTLFVQGNITGTSSATVSRITLDPAIRPTATAPAVVVYNLSGQDNGVATNGIKCTLNPATDVTYVEFRKTPGGGTFTTSGTKAIDTSFTMVYSLV